MGISYKLDLFIFTVALVLPILLVGTYFLTGETVLFLYILGILGVIIFAKKLFEGDNPTMLPYRMTVLVCLIGSMYYIHGILLNVCCAFGGGMACEGLLGLIDTVKTKEAYEADDEDDEE